MPTQKTTTAADLRSNLADILVDTEAGTHYRITHYGRPTGVLVPTDWYDRITTNTTDTP